MSMYLDRKYLLLSQARLQQFKQKANDLYNFRCPFCGDSKKNKLKARGYVYKAQNYNGYGYRCWNCNISTNFTTFLKHVDIAHYKDYMTEKFEEQGKGPNTLPLSPAVEAKINEELQLDDSPVVGTGAIKLPSIVSLPVDHYARVYIAKRMIPQKYWEEIYYAEDFKAFMDETFPTHGKENLKTDDPRIVMFYTDPVGNITHVNGRSFSADPKLRYIKIKVADYKKIYGLKWINITRPVYVTEGEFDSMFLTNAIASGDSALNGTAAWLQDTYGVRPTLVFDREPRNLELVKQIETSVEEMWNVCMLPDTFPGKDINDAVLNGMSINQIQDIIDKNTYEGLGAKLRLASWRKC